MERFAIMGSYINSLTHYGDLWQLSFHFWPPQRCAPSSVWFLPWRQSVCSEITMSGQDCRVSTLSLMNWETHQNCDLFQIIDGGKVGVTETAWSLLPNVAHKVLRFLSPWRVCSWLWGRDRRYTRRSGLPFSCSCHLELIWTCPSLPGRNDA